MENEKIKVLVIDDEFPARKLLTEYISKVPNFELKGVCEDAIEATNLLNNEPIDLIFTDIQMPELSGLDFIKSITEKPMVIFTTAYSEYAIESYSLDAIDYLLKPISFPRFMQAVNKVTERIKIRTTNSKSEKKDYFMVKADYKLYRIDFSDILFIEGQSEYVTFHLKDKKKITAYYSLKKLEEELPADNFFRIHKSFIISLSKIESIEGTMVTVAGQKLSIGKNYKNEFMNLLTKN